MKKFKISDTHPNIVMEKYNETCVPLEKRIQLLENKLDQLVNQKYKLKEQIHNLHGFKGFLESISLKMELDNLNKDINELDEIIIHMRKELVRKSELLFNCTF